MLCHCYFSQLQKDSPGPATDSDTLRKTVSEQASERADYIVALAKSKMLDDFDEPEAADAVIKPYFLEGLRHDPANDGIT
jgi:hypothetical protein